MVFHSLAKSVMDLRDCLLKLILMDLEVALRTSGDLLNASLISLP